MAHVGRLPNAAAQELLGHHRQPFEDALLSLSFLANYRLVAVGKEGYRWLLRDQTAQSLSSDELPVLAGSEERSRLSRSRR